MNIIKMQSELIDNIENNIKRATTRLGLKTKYTLGPVEFVNTINSDDRLDGYTVYKIEAIAFCDISSGIAKEEGYDSLMELRDKLVEIYGPIRSCQTVTVIYFEQQEYSEG